MESVTTSQALDAVELQMPVQWSFKDRRGNGAHVEVFLRRVKAGNEVELADDSDGGFATHLKGKFSDAETLLARLDDKALEPSESKWMKEVVAALFIQMGTTLRHSRQLLELFSRKGKLEIYGPNTLPFRPQYISANFTLKIHVTSFAADEITNLFTHMIAQHLDYPFAPGERRYSTSRLFDLCFLADKLIAPKGLAADIDRALLARGIYQPSRQSDSEMEQFQQLCSGQSASIRTSYERVLQRERFASFVAAMTGRSRTPENVTILKHYFQILQVDLNAQEQVEYKYPERSVDEFAAAIHAPLMQIFNEGSHGSH